VLILFWRTWHFDFLNYDDDHYVTDNPHVMQGLTANGIAWAFRSTEVFNWHPLTWISLMLDAQCFGLNAGGFHFVNALLHAANSVLLFLLLRKITGAIRRSAFVAAAFAIHPLHVESVAWISERKDVLSGFFFVLTLLAYAQFIEKSKIKNSKSKKFYALALLAFACGLMSKPMLVTLPFVLLLLDFWPLQRFAVQHSAFNVRNLVIEKIPFFILSTASCVITFLAQQHGGAVGSLENLPLQARVISAVVSVARYFGKIFWPKNLAIFYPYPAHWPWEFIAAGILIFVAGIYFSIRLARSRPHLAVGIFWFFGMLLPVIGLVQVGSQSLADRYTYLPSIGIFISLAWGTHELLQKRFPQLVIVGASLLLAFWFALAWRQIDFWRDTPTLFEHSIQAAGESAVVDNGLGNYFLEHGELNRGLDYIRHALQLQPQMEEAQLNYAMAMLRLGKFDDAIDECQKILARRDNLRARVNLGSALAAQGKTDEAIEQYRLAIQAQPDLAEAHFNLGNALYRTGKLDDAISEFQLAIQFKPAMAAAHFNLGAIYLAEGKRDLAITEFNEALRLQPDLEPAKQQLRALGVSTP